FVVRHYKAKTMTRTHAPFASKDVVWLAIDSTSHNTPQKSSAWKKKEGFKYPVLQDASGKVGRAYGAKTTPHMYVIDKDGVLRFAGGIDDDPRGRSKSPNNFVTAALTAVVDGKTPAQQHSTPYGCTVKYAAEGSCVRCPGADPPVRAPAPPDEEDGRRVPPCRLRRRAVTARCTADPGGASTLLQDRRAIPVR